MKLPLRIGIIFFGLVSLAAFIVSVSMVVGLYTGRFRDDGPDINYHFALYLPDNRNSFFNEIIAGAERAAAELNAVITIHSIDPAKNELEMAPYTGADGFIVCPYLEDSLARRQLDRISGRNSPLVIINHTVPNDQPWPFIGTNNFDVGRRMGFLAENKNDDPIHLAVVYSDKSPGIFGERELVEMGITAAIGGSLASPIMGLKTNINPMDAEALLYRLFRDEPRINTIIFTDANDTIAAAQTLVDMNLVGKVRITGFGDDEVILEYIRKGIIAGTVVTNPDRIGYEAVRSLASLRSTGYTSASIDTGVRVVDGGSL
ncbi:sugar ABC transporter substrate-binding protein [Breznakiella homolactica]|uniref:Substrate-binding domain-containing protein n=1 Tax=Breznakiella homolactica TaxID=2798577 RepID=A0A7T7XR84_9SPIR|nr:substrate-binding domain-containing protein [Breznakiella homolactica]QQO11021.1 substrate-binding domain-containing protein [Breznakiella homolactica]